MNFPFIVYTFFKVTLSQPLIKDIPKIFKPRYKVKIKIQKWKPFSFTVHTQKTLSHKTQNRSLSLFSNGFRHGGQRSHLWRWALSVALFSAHIIWSLAPWALRGILTMASTSLGRKHWRIRSSFHSFRSPSIRSWTLTTSDLSLRVLQPYKCSAVGSIYPSIPESFLHRSPTILGPFLPHLGLPRYSFMQRMVGSPN